MPTPPAPAPTEQRADITPVAPGDVTEDPLAAPEAGELGIYHPIPYRVDADEDVTCPHCQLKNDTDATFCDQCGTELAGRADVTVGGVAVEEPYAPEAYDPEADESVQCPTCQKRNDPDASYCDQCGLGLVGRSDVNTDGPYEDVDNVDVLVQTDGEPTVEPPVGAEENINDGSRAKRPPRENLIRSRVAAGVTLRDVLPADGTEGGNGSLLFGHFSLFDQWYEIDSYWEGTFLESVAPGAFKQTMVDDLASMRVLYDHGFDPQLGNKPLGPITVLREDNVGAYYEVPLLDTDYNRDFVLPVLQGRLMSGQQVGSQLGASFRFIVLDETWEQKPNPSEFNQLGIPQRVITRAQVLEFGPVTFPASPGASSGVRSQTDRFINQLRNDPLFLARYTERAGLRVVEKILSSAPADGRAKGDAANAAKPEDLRAARVSQLRRRARAALTL